MVDAEIRSVVCHTPGLETAPIFIDTTVLNSAAVRFESKDVVAGLARMEAEKVRKYGVVAQAAGARFVPFALDVFGSLCAPGLGLVRDAIHFIKLRGTTDIDLAGFVSVDAAVFSALSRALALGNGVCLLMSGRLRVVGVSFGLGTVRRVLEPAVVVDEGDNAWVGGGEGEADMRSPISPGMG